MKKKKLFLRHVFLLLLPIALLVSSCSHPSGVNGTDGIDNSKDDNVALHDNNGVSDKDEVSGKSSDPVIIGDGFIRGFDASAVDYDEKLNGTVFYDSNGNKIDFFKILAAHAYTTVRLRIFVDPDNAPVTDSYWQKGDEGWKSGNNTLERTIRMATRAKEAGLNVLLDFFYSDYWADPGKQVIPASWQSITTADAMATKVSDYTKEILTAMKNADVLPAYVQVGNEIDSGILLHTAYNNDTKKTTDAESAVQGKSGSENFVKYLKAGCDAVRAVAPDTKIILHVTNRKPTNILTTAVSSQLNYDIVGLSFYPFENNHGTIADLKKSIATFKGNSYGKQVMVTESATYFAYDAGSYSDLANVAKHMIDPSTGSVYSDIETETVNGSTLIVKGTINNQFKTLRHIMVEAAGAGASGIFYWGGEYRGHWKYALFDGNGKAMTSIDCFNAKVTIGDDTSGGGEETKETMQATFVFKDFTAEKLTVKYGGDGVTTTVDATVAADKKSATLSLDGSYKKSSGWMDIVSLQAYAAASDTEALNIEFDSASNNQTGAWFEFANGGTITITYKKVVTGTQIHSDAYTADGGISQLVAADKLSNLSIKSLIIEATDCNWSNTSGDWWLSAYTDSSWSGEQKVNWQTNTYYKAEITDSSFISAIKTNGLYIAGLAGMTCTLKVSYTQ